MSPLRSVLLGHRDRDRIHALLMNTDAAEFSLLYDELDAAIVMDEHLLPSDVVTMNSRITFADLDKSTETTVTLVYPQEVANTPQGVSILAPVGAALIGLRAGETVEWPLPNGAMRRLRVVSVQRLS